MNTARRVQTPALLTATVMPGGHTFTALADQTILQSAELANISGLQMDSSCRNGTCRTCMCQLLKGEVAYRIAWPGLSIDEKREGWILPCVAYPRTDVVLQLPG